MKTNNEPTVEQKELISRLPDYSIKDLAKVIKKNWEKVNFGAVPYLDAMFSLESIQECCALFPVQRQHLAGSYRQGCKSGT